MIITINGCSGSGKSSVSKALAARLGYKVYSAGDVRRNYAREHGMTLEELNKKAVDDPASDLLVDEYMKQLCKTEDNFVVESRLGFLFFPKSIKIYLNAQDEVRAKRTMEKGRLQESHKDLNEAIKKLRARDKGDVARYMKLYKVNHLDMKHYNLIVDTSNNTVEQTTDIVYDFVMKKMKKKV